MFLQRAWNKYGEKCFDFSIIEVITNNKDKLSREQYWMDYYNCYDRIYGYNVNKRSDVPDQHSASYISLSNEKHIITWEQFVMIVFWLYLFDDPIPLIAKRLGVSEKTVYQIYYHENYSEMTKTLTSQKKKTWTVCKKNNRRCCIKNNSRFTKRIASY